MGTLKGLMVDGKENVVGNNCEEWTKNSEMSLLETLNRKISLVECHKNMMNA